MIANKPNRFNKPASPVAEYYPSLEVEGDDFEARFKRLEASERYLSGQIASLQEVVLPNFVSRLSDCTEKDRPNIEKAMFKANQNLLALRKEYRATSKAISDIEFRRVSTLGGMIPFAFVIDMLTASIKPVMTYLHNIANGVHDEAEAAKLNCITAEIIKVFNAAATEFIQGVSGQVPEKPPPTPALVSVAQMPIYLVKKSLWDSLRVSRSSVSIACSLILLLPSRSQCQERSRPTASDSECKYQI
jgi:hypothetical protein